MADPTPTPAPVVNPVPAGPQAPAPTPVPSPDDKPENAIPYSRFKEVNEQLKALREKEEAREQAERQAKEDKLKKDGEYKTLLEQKEAEIIRLKKVEEEYNSTQKSLRDAALAKITDEKMKEIAVDLPTPKLLALVEQLSTQPVGGPNTPKGKPADTKPSTLSPLPGETPLAYSERMRTSYQRKQ